MIAFLGLAVLGSFLPIWRQGTHNRESGGLNFWEYVNYINQSEFEPFGHPHIPYSEAEERAREAYEKRGINISRSC